MAVAYSKLYEIIYKNVDNKEKAENIYKAVEEFIKENEQRIENKFKDEKVIIKNELKDELKKELSTKEDIIILEQKMDTMEERLKRHVDNRFNQLNKKITVGFIILFISIVILNPTTLEFVKLFIK
jgi:ABC-type Fe3+/spermidine/putrescine transport system ATPase subunit